MRITSEMQSHASIRQIQANYARLSKLEEQLSSGKRILRPSDSPAEIVQVNQNNAENLRLDSHLKTIRDAGVVLQTSVDALTESREVLTHAKDIAIEVNSAAHDAASDGAFAHQIDVVLDQMLRVGNRQLPDGRYLFGGTASNAPPFVVTATNSSQRPKDVDYRGSDQQSEAVVGKAISVGTLIPGSDVFQKRHRMTTDFTGTTGARPGTGTDSASKPSSLLVKHSLTTISGASGLRTGTSSAASDTIIGPSGAHTLTIVDTSRTGASGTVSLNGGPAVAFTNSGTNLRVTGPSGEAVFLNTTTIAAGYKGTVSLTATGTMSVDGGITSQAIQFNANQVVTDGATGEMTNVDSSQIRRAGAERLDYQGASDAFQVLIALRDDIRNVNGLSAIDRSQAIGRHIAALDRINNDVIETLGSQSVQAEYLSKLESRTADVQLNIQEATDNIEAVDVAGTIAAIQKQQTLYEMSLQLTARANSLSLADFLN